MVNDEERMAKMSQEEMSMMHVHTFLTETNVACEHQHIMLGVSGPFREYGGSHVHRLRGRTSFMAEEDEGHWHLYDVMTGPAVPMPDGTHTHYYNGKTSYDDGHCHTFADVTGLAPDQGLEDDCDDDDDDDDLPHNHHHKHKRPDEK
ncbi:hypothetical protein SDC9_27497 [bioreactor metagenome]|uniref:YmaF family protein n=1 Tax=bioreactor metagenome TaxID=1076179 RepID=A0A644URC0_9ZZZZ|nr:YmaF family protein [Negativicutes bacterium]